MRQIAGIHACKQVIYHRPKAISKVWVKSNWSSNPELLEMVRLLQNKNICFQEVGDKKLQAFCATNQGIALEVSDSPKWDFAKWSEREACQLLLLDQLQDPHNFGAILRSAWLLGAPGIFYTKERSVQPNASVAKVASGGAEYVALDQVGNIKSELKMYKEAGFWVYGLDGEASNSLWQADLPPKVIWVLGSEAKGMRKSTLNVCDDCFSLPQLQAEASYNVSVAAALAMSEFTRKFGIG